MQLFKQAFTTRQHMVTPDFEYFHYVDDPTVEVEYHNHDFYEIYIYISGRVSYIIEGTSYRLKPGDILLVHSRELHKPVIEPGESYQRIVLWVNPDFLHSQSIEGTNLSMCFEMDLPKRHNLLRPGSEMSANIKSILNRFERACTNSAFGNPLLRNTYLLELIIYLNRAVLETYEDDITIDIEFNEKINTVIRYINDNLCENLLLDNISSKFFMSKYHLLREFKKHTGFTIHRYICQKRLIAAKSMLKDGFSVTEACSKCGFNDYSNFIRSFKNNYGIPPRKYMIGSHR
ncbi:MAG: helix-turn-helix domain-containing protein [Ruminiclostridium sp.]|nr:helix-turn-helix domain-containing protein [Ruminiclostridium sp.]